MTVELPLIADDGHVREVVAGEGVPHVARQRVALQVQHGVQHNDKGSKNIFGSYETEHLSVQKLMKIQRDILVLSKMYLSVQKLMGAGVLAHFLTGRFNHLLIWRKVISAMSFLLFLFTWTNNILATREKVL